MTCSAGRASEVHAAASRVFTELIAASDVTIGETLMAKGLGGYRTCAVGVRMAE